MDHQNTTKFVSLKMKKTPMSSYKVASSPPNAVIRFNFNHYREIHHFCDDDESPFPEDHNILSKELDEESSFKAVLILPLEPETVEYYVVCAEMGEDDWPDFVCPQVWKAVKEKVSEYVLKHADFDGKLGFEMVVDVGFSTLDIPCC